MNLPNFERIYSLCRKFLHPPVDAENIAAEIVLESWKKGKDASYLYIKSRCYDELRKYKREETFRRSLQVKQERSQLEDSRVNGCDVESCFRAVLLSREEREVLYLKFYKGLSHFEMSLDLKVPEYKISLLVTSLKEKFRAAKVQDDNPNT